MHYLSTFPKMLKSLLRGAFWLSDFEKYSVATSLWGLGLFSRYHGRPVTLNERSMMLKIEEQSQAQEWVMLQSDLCIILITYDSTPRVPQMVLALLCTRSLARAFFSTTDQLLPNSRTPYLNLTAAPCWGRHYGLQSSTRCRLPDRICTSDCA